MTAAQIRAEIARLYDIAYDRPRQYRTGLPTLFP